MSNNKTDIPSTAPSSSTFRSAFSHPNNYNFGSPYSPPNTYTFGSVRSAWINSNFGSPYLLSNIFIAPYSSLHPYNFGAPSNLSPSLQVVGETTVKKQSKLLFSSSEDKNKNCENASVHGSFQDFSNDFASIQNDTSSTDITIECGSVTLKVHKLILNARSPVFKAMFNSPMRESIESTVSIEDLDSQTVQDLMYFIYSNQVQNLSVPKACSLLEAAEKYELNSLKRICVHFLVSNLSVENAFLILQKVDLYDKEMKLSTIDFIRDNFSILNRTKEWENIVSHNETLALEVLDFI